MKDSDYCCEPERGPQRSKLDRKLDIKELDGSLPSKWSIFRVVWVCPLFWRYPDSIHHVMNNRCILHFIPI